MRMNNVEVHMKDDRLGDKAKIVDCGYDYNNHDNRTGIIVAINPVYIRISAESGCYPKKYLNLSLRGRKAALASSKKVGRDSKGRFTKKVDTVNYMLNSLPYEPKYYYNTLESLEKRIEALEKKQRPRTLTKKEVKEVHDYLSKKYNL